MKLALSVIRLKLFWTTTIYLTKLYGVEVNPISKKEIKWSDYKKVPILMVDGQQMVDSSDIIDKLAEKFRSEASVKPSSQVDDEEKKWRGFFAAHRSAIYLDALEKRRSLRILFATTWLVCWNLLIVGVRCIVSIICI